MTRINPALLAMAAPATLLFLVFSYAPMLGIVIAFKRLRVDKGFLGSPWVGFDNFRFFFESQDAWRITRNTVLLNSLFILVGLAVALALALMLFELRNRLALKFFQTVFFFPFFLSWVVVGYMLYAFLNIELGIGNSLLKFLGLSPVSWYTSPEYWRFILVFIHVWKSSGYFAVIYYSGILGIDEEYYEAAAIDGANKLQVIFKIILPLLSPVITVVVLLQIGKIFFADFGLFYFTTRDIGNLYPTTDVIDTYVYRSLRVTGDIGMASAAGFYQSIVGFLLVVVSNLVVRKTNPDNALF
jgi:putative aldouronate transport system permease protein